MRLIHEAALMFRRRVITPLLHPPRHGRELEL